MFKMKRAAGVRIRRAMTEDAAALASVLQQAFAEYEPFYTKQGYAATTPAKATIITRMQEGPVWVAVHRKHIVGTVSVVRREKGLYVRGMAVLPAARGLGVGRQLLDEVEAFAAADGREQLVLSTTPFLHRAIRLYESVGFSATDDGPGDLFGTPLVTMKKKLTHLPRLSLADSVPCRDRG
jgi:ribosomal protein S18 acetylase RimI-like enzyme